MISHCDRASHKHGKDRQGFQRYKCPACGKTFSDNPNPQKAGRKPEGDRALTNAERKQRQRSKAKGKLSSILLDIDGCFC